MRRGTALMTIGLVMMALVAVSVFLWTAFDIRWWVPVGEDAARGVALAVAHFFMFVGGLLLVATGSDE